MSPSKTLAKPQKGFGLVSLILALVLSTAVVGLVFVAYGYNKRSADVADATRTVRSLNQRVVAAYSSAASFSGLTTESAQAEKIYPADMLTSGQPRSAWHGLVTLAAASLNGGTDKGFVLTYQGVDPSACVNFAVNASAGGFHDVNINGTTAMSGRKVTPSLASKLCAQTQGLATVQFIQGKGGSNAALTPCSVPGPQTQTAACPVGQVSSVAPYGSDGITQTRTGFCNSAYGLPGWSPWTTTGNTCVPACVAPAASTVNQTLGCPGGQSGSIEQQQTTTYACSSPVGAAITTVGAWVTTSDTCAATCVAPAATTATRTIACPASQTGTWTQQQVTSWTCPAVTGAPVSSVGAWTDTSNTCMTPPPTINVNYDWRGESESFGQDNCNGSERVNSGQQTAEALARNEAQAALGACSAALVNTFYPDQFAYCDGMAGDVGQATGATCVKFCTNNAGQYVTCP